MMYLSIFYSSVYIKLALLIKSALKLLIIFFHSLSFQCFNPNPTGLFWSLESIGGGGGGGGGIRRPDGLDARRKDRQGGGGVSDAPPPNGIRVNHNNSTLIMCKAYVHASLCMHTFQIQIFDYII